MPSIKTYVFIDLETTGIPRDEQNRTKVTELSMVAVKKSHLIYTKAGECPRVRQKLTLCFNPRRRVDEAASSVTGLSNDLLEFEPPFDEKAVQAINNYINLLTKPVCLVAHNGFFFDYPILQSVLRIAKCSFPSDLMCADSLDCYRDYFSPKPDLEVTNSNESFEELSPKLYEAAIDLVDGVSQHDSFQDANETTPKRQKIMNVGNKQPRKEIVNHNEIKNSKVCRTLFPSQEECENMKLRTIYKTLLKKDAVLAHDAEGDCILLCEVAVATSKHFTKWVEENCRLFADIPPMEPGKRIGT